MALVCGICACEKVRFLKRSMVADVVGRESVIIRSLGCCFLGSGKVSRYDRHLVAAN